MTSSKDAWRTLAEGELRGRPLDDLTWKTLEGIEVQPIYNEDDLQGVAHLGTIPNVTRAALGAQTNALGFYEKLGFVASGPDFMDANIPHRMMERPL